MKKILFAALAFILIFTGTAHALEVVRQVNVATRIVFPIVDADGDLVTGAAGLDSEVDEWNDGGNPDGFTDCTNEATEIGTSGIYYLLLANTEIDQDYSVIQVKTSTSGAKTQIILIRTMVGNINNAATTDDGGTINVTGGAVDTVTTTTTATNLTNAPTNGDLTATMKTSVTTAATSSTPALSTAGVTAIWNKVISDYSGAGYAGTYLKGIYDKLPAGTIGTSTYAGGAVASVTGAVGSISGVTFPTNFGVMSISATTGLVDITQAAADKVWGTTTRLLTAGTNIVLAKSTGITGFNDITVNNIWDEVVTSHTTTLSFAKLLKDNLDTNIGSRGTSTLTATNVWQTDISGYGTAGQAGTYLKSAGGAADPWLTSLPGSYTSGTAGYIIGNNLNATVASRSSHTAADVATAILVTPANKIANATDGKVTVGTNDDKTGYSILGTKTTLDALNDITAAGVWAAATRTLSAGTNIVLAKGVGITGFNDIAATDVWAAAARTLTAGTNIVLAKGVGITGFNDIAATDVWATTTRTLSAFGFNVTVGTNNDKTGYSLSSAGVQAIWDALTSALTTVNSIGKLLVDNINATIGSRSSHSAADVATAILVTPANKIATATGGKVTVGTNDDKTGYTVSTVSDKTGYSLTQGFPTNFSSMAITSGGAVTAGTVSDKTGYSLSQVFPTNFSSLVISALGKITVGTNDDKSGYSLSSAGIQAIWDALTSALTTVNSIGKLLVDNINATIGSRSTLTAANVWDYNVSGYSSVGLAGTYLKNAGGGSSPDEIAAAVWGYTTRSLTGFSFLDAATIADAIWDEILSGHTIAGSTGKKLNEMPTPYSVGP